MCSIRLLKVSLDNEALRLKSFLYDKHDRHSVNKFYNLVYDYNITY